MKKYLISIVALLTFLSAHHVDKKKKKKVVKKRYKHLPKRIAHAGGSIHGRIYTNSKEAIEKSVRKRGCRTIEIDLHRTMNGKLVAFHGNKNTRYLYYDNFIRQKIYSKYTPLDSDGLVALSLKHNITLLPDFKTDYRHGLRTLCKSYTKKGKDCRNYVIPTIYHFYQMYYPTSEMHFKKVFVFTYGMSKAEMKNLPTFLRIYRKYIRAVAFYKHHSNTKGFKYAKRWGIPTYIHTVNRQIRFWQRKAGKRGGLITDHYCTAR